MRKAVLDSSYLRLNLRAALIAMAFLLPIANVFSAGLISPRVITITAVDTLAPDPIEQTAARLKGDISLDQTYSTVEYYFEYGLSTVYTQKTPVQFRRGDISITSNVFAEITELDCGTSYHFRLVTDLTAIDAETVSTVFGNDAVFTTLDCNPVKLLAIGVSSTTQEGVFLAGSFSADGLESSIYFKYGDTVDMLLSTSPKTQAGKTITEIITGLKCGTKYYYQLFISNDISAPIESEVLSFDSAACPVPPAIPSVIDLDPIDVLSNSAKLRAEVSPNSLMTSVTFEYGATQALELFTPAIAVSGDVEKRTVEFPVLSLSCATRYYFQVVVSNELGSVEGVLQNFSTQACGAEPVPIVTAPNIFSGGFHSIVIGASGELVTWGDNQFGQLGGSTIAINVIDVLRETVESDGNILYDYQFAAAGARHTILLHKSGWVSAFGDNSTGQSGVSGTASIVSIPAAVVDASGEKIMDAVDVAAGDKHSVAVKKDGRIWAWGDNTYGQLANLTETMSPVATYIDGVNNALNVSAGKNFSVARLLNNTLIAWGRNDNGQLGDDTNETKFEPVAVIDAENIIAIAAGAEHVLALNKDGKVLSWGSNAYGQLGLGDKDNRAHADYVEADLLAGVVQLSAGARHSLALLNNGTVVGWGDNSQYQLGIEDREPALSPVFITDSSGAALSGIESIAAGDNFSAVLTSDGRIITWGDNDKGQLSGRSSMQALRATLTNAANTSVNMKKPRIIVSDTNLNIKEGESANLVVWLTEDPEQNVTLTTTVANESGLIVKNTETLEFTSDDWFIKRTIAIQAGKANSNARELFLEAAGYGSIKVSINVSPNDKKALKPVVGNNHPIFLMLLFIFLLYSRAETAGNTFKVR